MAWLYLGKHKTFAVSALLTVVGCSPTNTLSEETKDLIALCSAGIGLKLDIGLSTELDLFANGGSISSETSNEIRGAIFRGSNLSDAEVERAYSNYLGCIRGEKRQDEYLALLELRRDTVRRELSALGVTPDEIESLTDLMSDHIAATRNKDTVLAHELHRKINFEIARIVDGDSLAPYYQIS